MTTATLFDDVMPMQQRRIVPVHHQRPVLRDYQLEAIDAIEKARLDGHRRILLVLATGLGKTVTFAEIIRRHPGRALVLAHRDELLSQAIAKLVSAGIHADDIGRVQANFNESNAMVVVGSVQTLARKKRREKLVSGNRPFDVIVVDEAHHAPAQSYKNILEDLGALTSGPDGPMTIGVTATPMRIGMGDLFQKVAYEMDLLTGIQSGFLVDIVGRSVRLRMNLSKVKMRAGDYAEREMAEALTAANAPMHVVDAWVTHAEQRSTLVFAASVGLAHETAAAFNARGIKAESIDGTLDSESRHRILADFRAEKTRVLCNYGVLTEGLDVPNISCVVLARPTKSDILFAQMVGRGTRLSPGKKDLLVLDLVDSTNSLKSPPVNLSSLALCNVRDGESLVQARSRNVQEKQDREDRIRAREEARRKAMASASTYKPVPTQSRQRDFFAPLASQQISYKQVPSRTPASSVEIAWVKLGESYAVGIQSGHVTIVRPEGIAGYTVSFMPTQGWEETISANLTLDEAKIVAAVWIDQRKEIILADKNASWRSRPVSVKARFGLIGSSAKHKQAHPNATLNAEQINLLTLTAGQVASLRTALECGLPLGGATIESILGYTPPRREIATIGNSQGAHGKIVRNESLKQGSLPVTPKRRTAG